MAHLKITQTHKQTVVRKHLESKKYWMSQGEYVGIVVGKEATQNEYVISDGIIESGSFIPEHYHKWEDQTFHVIAGTLEAKIGNTVYTLGPGDTIQCPRGVSHYMKNIGTETASMISYIFPGVWAEEFMQETSRQMEFGQIDLSFIEEQFGVVYTKKE